MRSVLIYFVQSFAASGILYGYYHLFLRNKRFHQYNRLYLLSAAALSLIVPILHIDIYFTSQQDIPSIYQLLADVRVNSNTEVHAPFLVFSWAKATRLVYLLIAAFFLMRLFTAFVQIIRLKAKHHAEKLENITFIPTQSKQAPFSFFRWLFWNEKINVESAAGQTIFRHELFHIQQKHSWDVIYLELLTTIFWINPFFHLIKKEVKAIHEFLADSFAAGHHDKWEYAELLVSQALQQRQQFTSPFFNNQIKRRIAMITNSNKPSCQYLRKVMVLPIALFIVTVVAVNCTTKDNKEATANNSEAKTESLSQKTEQIKKEAIPQDVSPEIKSKNDEENKIYAKVDIEAMFPGGSTAWRKFLEQNLSPGVPVDNGAPPGIYQVNTQFVVNKDGSISDLRAITNFGYGMEEEALRVIKRSPRWVPAVHKANEVTAYRRQPITFQISAE